MIFIKFTGGLGNQMFQYALGRKLSVLQKTELAFDISWYEKSPNRKFLLDNFQVLGKPISRSNRVKKLFTKKIKEQSFLFDSRILSAGKNSYLDGYWQSPKYFDDIENILRKDFTLKNPQSEKYETMLKKIAETNSVSLHIRRGDYLAVKNTAVYTPCSMEYYKKGIEYIVSKVGMIDICIFSDDTAWVKENLKTNFPILFVSDEGFSDYQELLLMSACKHNITANSTFGWWGAWLNKNPQKTIITPKKWFSDENKNQSDLIPPTWIQL